jgi:probable HAF family extracellular repeat protein
VLSEETFTPIDVPGSAGTGALGINKKGEIVGFYTDASTGQSRGFVLSKGSFTPIDVPGSTSTLAFGINHGGQVVGIYSDPNGTQHGFLATPTKK